MTFPTHQVETTLQQDGTLTLEHLPFPAGQPVAVTIVPLPATSQPANPYPLRGAPLRYDRPTDPAALDDWDALR